MHAYNITYRMKLFCLLTLPKECPGLQMVNKDTLLAGIYTCVAFLS